ncbi:hypothetical protein [Miniphocaeibacter massiliensis]|uniref:hypothetical protein n=1 Tax=Miniphocaeibacter massiliensis TaxID=2041841 RepID=UPI000C071310|nr:hypothetical protein [Miniphocaeibacter massiliensis]
MENNNDKSSLSYSKKLNEKIDIIIRQVDKIKKEEKLQDNKVDILEIIFLIPGVLSILVLILIPFLVVLDKVFMRLLDKNFGSNSFKLIDSTVKLYDNFNIVKMDYSPKPWHIVCAMIIASLTIFKIIKKVKKTEKAFIKSYVWHENIEIIIIIILHFMLLIIIPIIMVTMDILPRLEKLIDSGDISALASIFIFINFISSIIYIGIFFVNNKLKYKISFFDIHVQDIILSKYTIIIYLIISIVIYIITTFNLDRFNIIVFLLLHILNFVLLVFLSWKFNFKKNYFQDRIYGKKLIQVYANNYSHILDSTIVFPRIKKNDFKNIKKFISDSRIYYVDLSDINGELYSIRTPYYSLKGRGIDKNGFYISLPIDKNFNNKYLRVKFTMKKDEKKYLRYVLDIKIRYRYGDCIIESSSFKLVNIKRKEIKSKITKYDLNNIEKKDEIILEIPTAILYSNYASISNIKIKIKNTIKEIEKSKKIDDEYLKKLENIIGKIEKIVKSDNDCSDKEMESIKTEYKYVKVEDEVNITECEYTKTERSFRKSNKLSVINDIRDLKKCINKKISKEEYNILSDIFKGIIEVLYKYNNKSKVSTNGIIIEKDDKTDQRNTLLIDQKFGTGKTLAIVNAMSELKKNTARISFYEEPIDIDKVYKIFSNVKKSYIEIGFGNKINYFFKIIRKAFSYPIILLYAFSVLAAVIISGSSMLEKLNKLTILDEVKDIILNYYVVKYTALIILMVVIINYIPEIIKIVHKSSNNYIDFYLELTTELMVSGNIVLMVEDIDRMRSEDMFDVVSLISNYNFHLEELGSDICNIVLSVDKEKFEEKLDSIYDKGKSSRDNNITNYIILNNRRFNSIGINRISSMKNNNISEGVNTFIEKTIYRTIKINNDIIKEYTEALSSFITKYNEQIEEEKDKKYVNFNENTTSLREVRKQYREQIERQI